MAISKVTISSVNSKVGSIVVTPVDATKLPEYFLNLQTIKLVGDNPFIPGGSVLNPQASISLVDMESNQIVLTRLISDITTIGGVATPATLALTMAAIANLIAE